MANLQASSFTDLTLPSGTTAQRPASPTLGMVRYNTTISLLEYYDGTNWRPVTGYSAGTIGSGGTITKVNNNIVHTFTTVGSATFTPSFTGYVQVLVVAGGAGPGGGWGGGANTSIDSSRLRVFGGLGITGQGFPGGSGVRFNDDSENTHNGGGGGGAGGPGWASQDENQQQATHGGPGAASDILGDILYWGGGGASGPHICDGGGGDGGVGGGGGGAAHYVPGFPRVGNGHGGGQALNKGQPATNNDGHARYGGDGGANTGGGGGNGGSTHGGGGSGIVVVRY
jgi:hypothetical protein